jgi:hypothetical protein
MQIIDNRSINLNSSSARKHSLSAALAENVWNAAAQRSKTKVTTVSARRRAPPQGAGAVGAQHLPRSDR